MKRIVIVLLSYLLSSILVSTSFAGEKHEHYEQPNVWLSRWLNEENAVQNDSSETNSVAPQKAAINMPYNIATLATVGKNGQPTTRIIQISTSNTKEGIIFYTHSATTKAMHLKQNPRVALNIWLPNGKRQVSIEGKAEKLPSSYAKQAWSKMPKWMQINLIISDHKNKLDSREQLESKVLQLQEKYKAQDIPMVDSFVAYSIQPNKYIFYSVHFGSFADKFVATKGADNKWTIERKQP